MGMNVHGQGLARARITCVPLTLISMHVFGESDTTNVYYS